MVIRLLNILVQWITFDDNYLKSIVDHASLHYFDLDIIKCSKDEVFVDLGGYIGDTVIDHINTYGQDSYKEIYTYEITPKTFEILKDNLKRCRNIISIRICFIMYISRWEIRNEEDLWL